MQARLRFLRAFFVVLGLLLVGHSVAAQPVPADNDEYQPKVGQAGKDVVWVPTPEALVERMLDMANVGPNDFVIDLGSGDGRTVIAAAQTFGAHAKGIEYNPDMVALSHRNAVRAGVADKVEFVEADIFETDFSQATVVTMYLLPSLNLKLRPRILDLQPGTRIVSHSFDMADWEPDRKITVEDRNAFLWIVPADVSGNWRVSVNGPMAQESWSLRLVPDFQVLYGQVRVLHETFRLLDGRIRGEEIQFAFADASGDRREFTGRVNGGRMEGTMRDETGTAEWSAVRDRSDGSIMELDLTF